MGLNKKNAFKCAFEGLEDGEEPKTVNCDKFWENVELNAVVNTFPDGKIKSLEIKPRLNCWSPYLGKATRHGNNLLNTEFKKVNKSTGKLETDSALRQKNVFLKCFLLKNSKRLSQS